MSAKLFEWEKVAQGERAAAKNRQDELKEKIARLQDERTALTQKARELEEKLEERRSEIVRLDYDKKVLAQNYDSLLKETEELKATREKYLELVREHKLLADERSHLEKVREREGRLRESQVEELNAKCTQLTESARKERR